MGEVSDTTNTSEDESTDESHEGHSDSGSQVAEHASSCKDEDSSDHEGNSDAASQISSEDIVGDRTASSTDRDDSSSSADGESDGLAVLIQDQASACEQPETWVEHVRKFGPGHQCPRCRWMRGRDEWLPQLTYEAPNGEVGSWVEEVSGPAIPWGLGCKICRWAGLRSIFARGEVRSDRGTQLTALKRHGGHLPDASCKGKKIRCAQGHSAAQSKLLADDPARRRDPERPPRNDVPCLSLFYNEYNIAKEGGSFCSFTKNVEVLRASGAMLPKSRESRFVAKNIADVIGAELQSEDQKLLGKATDVALTMDARKSMLVVRARLTMGHGWPEGMRPMGGGKTPSSDPLMGGGQTPLSDPLPQVREIPNHYGRGVQVVERVIAFRQEGAFGGTPELADLLIGALRDACGSEDLYEKVRRRVRVFCPDGAANEQLAGRLAAEAFPNMCFVIRCSAHAAQGAIKTAWHADEHSRRITTTVVCEVAKFLRSSSRFALRFEAKARDGILTAVSNFDFAPQRFSSKERPLTRFVLYANAILITLGLEVTAPSSAERSNWALEILRQLQGPTWLLIGMLADLAEDAAKFVRLLDNRDLDPIAFAENLSKFMTFVKSEYVEGGMWLRQTGTYAQRISDMLANEKLLVFKQGYVVVVKPTKEESRQCIAQAIRQRPGGFPPTHPHTHPLSHPLTRHLTQPPSHPHHPPTHPHTHACSDRLSALRPQTPLETCTHPWDTIIPACQCATEHGKVTGEWLLVRHRRRLLIVVILGAVSPSRLPMSRAHCCSAWTQSSQVVVSSACSDALPSPTHSRRWPAMPSSGWAWQSMTNLREIPMPQQREESRVG